MTEFVDTDRRVPLIQGGDLSSFINSEQYPKTLLFTPNNIADAMGIEDEYLNMEILEIQQEIKDCSAIDSTVVYYYKSFNQKLLTPLYRIRLDCSFNYEGEQYFVPGITYVNAIDPEYVLTQ